jgi:hypothetical protein
VKMKTVLVLFALALTVADAYAAARSVRGLWVSTSDDRSYWLRIQTPNPIPATLVEELTGTITSKSVGGTDNTTREAKITGQYLVRTGIVVLNIGEPGTHREYAIGDTRAEGRHMNLRVFKVKSGQDLNYERELFFDPKSEPQP